MVLYQMVLVSYGIGIVWYWHCMVLVSYGIGFGIIWYWYCMVLVFVSVMVSVSYRIVSYCIALLLWK